MKYVLFGAQSLEFADLNLRVEASQDGTVFEAELDPTREESLKHCIKRYEPSIEERPKKGGR